MILNITLLQFRKISCHGKYEILYLITLIFYYLVRDMEVTSQKTDNQVSSSDTKVVWFSSNLAY